MVPDLVDRSIGGSTWLARGQDDQRGRKIRQNLGWAIGYNAIALPIAAGVFEPAFGLVLRPEIAALSMSGSSLLVAVNALLLKRLRLPAPPVEADTIPATPARPTAPVGGCGRGH